MNIPYLFLQKNLLPQIKAEYCSLLYLHTSCTPLKKQHSFPSGTKTAGLVPPHQNMSVGTQGLMHNGRLKQRKRSEAVDTYLMFNSIIQ